MFLTTIEAPEKVLPELAPELGDQLGDELLLMSAATTKVGKVTPGSRGSRAGQRHNARAWTASGSVD
jgi:hypothetical protein